MGIVAYIVHFILLIGACGGMVFLIRRNISSEQNYLIAGFACFILCSLGALIRLRATDVAAVEAAGSIVYLGCLFPALLDMLLMLKAGNRKLPGTIMATVIVLYTAFALFSTVLYGLGWYTVITDFRVDEHGFAYFSTRMGWVAVVETIVNAAVVMYSGICIMMYSGSSKDQSGYVIGVYILGTIDIIVSLIEAVANKKGVIMPYILGFVGCYLLFEMHRKKLVTFSVSPRDRFVENLPDAVILLDDEFRITDMNPAAEGIFDGMGGHKGRSIPEEYSFLLDDYNEIVAFTHRGMHLERHFVPVRKDGRIAGYGIVVTDVSRSHQMVLEMRELKRSADIANEAKSSFLANMSHEIRTPMNAIVGYADLLGREDLTKDGRKYANEIKNSSNFLLHIMNDILDFSNIEQGKLEILEEEYSPADMFREVCNYTALQADEKGLRFIDLTASEMPAKLYGDKVRIKQVLLNITGNAVKFTDSGSVTIEADWDRIGEEYAVLSVAVTDTGIGIAPENMNRLFSEFEQVDMRSTLTKPGTGLGLVISKALLEMMGGTINISSEFGAGTTVTITLKQRIISESGSLKEDGAAGEAAGRKNEGSAFAAPDAKILVVDDNRVNLELMVNYLKQYHIIPDTADGGEEAVELASKNRYDIIFMDQMMPEVDGVAAMKRIRAQGTAYSQKMPIIALTANAIAGTRNMLIGEGFTDYAAKPLPIGELEKLLLKYLPSGKYTIRAEEVAAGGISPAIAVHSDDGGLKLPDYVDMETGMTNAGRDIEHYREVIRIVSKYGDEKLDVLQKLLEEENFGRITIEVHALKSNAATVGAMELSERARKLEEAGKAGENDTIVRDLPTFLEDYGRFVGDLRICLDPGANESASGEQGTSQAAMSADSEEYMKSFEEIEKAIADGRYEDTADLIGVLEFFDLPSDIAGAVGDMVNASQARDWQSILDLIHGLKR